MMQGMMGYGFGGWLMMAAGLLLFAVLILAAAALIKYLFFGDRSGHGRREP